MTQSVLIHAVLPVYCPDLLYSLIISCTLIVLYVFHFRYKGNVIGNAYGKGTGPVVLIECIGNETSISDCNFYLPLQGCNHSQDVSVSCGRSPPVQYGNFGILPLSQ